jgi:membrane protein
MVKDTALAFSDDEALSRGAAIAFYTVTSIAPVLLLVIAIAGLVFGQDAAQSALLQQLTGLMGKQASEVLQSALASASAKSSGIVATAIGLVTLLATASGMFGEMQTALNRIWRAKPSGATVSRLVRARAASLGLVAALGFLLAVSLAVSAGLEAFGDYLNARLAFGSLIMSVINALVSLALLSVLFAAIYKILPDRPIAWRDVLLGAVATAILFTIGKSLIGWYLGSSAVASSYGAAGGLIILFLWVYYSTQVFLVGAEFTKVYATRHGRGPQPDALPAPVPNASVAMRDQSALSPGLAQGDAAVAEGGLSPLSRAEREAERHREALVQTIAAIAYRLRPSVMRRRAVAAVRRNALALQQSSRRHPLRAATAFGLAAVTGIAVATALHRAPSDDRFGE